MEPITITTSVKAPVEKVWSCWTEPEHITQWTHASDDWHAPHATNDVRVGGTFTTRMEAKDGSVGFDFGGTYTAVEEYKKIEYTTSDNRTVRIVFEDQGDTVTVIETFDPETENPIDMQRAGWQEILDNFKKYAEQHTVAS